MSNKTELSTLSFNEIHEFNKSINKSTLDELRKSLKAGQLAPFIEQFKSISPQLCAPKEFEIMSILLKRLEGMPFEQWSDILFPVITKLISRFTTSELAFFDHQHFSWITDIESQWEVIRNELTTALSHSNVLPAFQEVQEDQVGLTSDDLWKVIVFKGFGTNFDKIRALFPNTCRAIELIEEHSSAMISVLEPGKHIPPHTGLYKGVLRYHLGLKVPSHTGIRVKDIEAHWEEGKSLVFDDTFEHEAWNKSDETRAVLFVDFLRPLPFPLNVLNEFVVFDLMPLSDFVKKTVKNESKYKELEDLMVG